MPRTPSTRKRRRGWAWTLTVVAALLAVVWVGSMKVAVFICPTPTFVLCLSEGVVEALTNEVPFAWEPGVQVEVMSSWRAEWWTFRRAFAIPSRWALDLFGNPSTFLFAPLWPFVLLTGVPGMWMLIKTRTRANQHACPSCGYDRTGLPTSNETSTPCPECGTKIAREVDGQ